MAKIVKNIEELVGRTPLFEFEKFEENTTSKHICWENWSILIHRVPSRTAPLLT